MHSHVALDLFHPLMPSHAHLSELANYKTPSKWIIYKTLIGTRQGPLPHGQRI